LELESFRLKQVGLTGLRDRPRLSDRHSTLLAASCYQDLHVS
jgi:hypothetical protein